MPPVSAVTLPGLPSVEITLRRSARVRRFSLRVSSLDGRVTLSMPARARLSEALLFAQSHEDWLKKTLARQVPVQRLGFGAVIPFEGRALTLAPGKTRIRLEGDVLHIPGEAAQLGPRLASWLKAQARDRLAAASDHYAGLLGRKPKRITLRDTRSRWGSCAHDGALMYSWRLVMAPPQILAYVAAHECAHLVEMNHSAAFWDVVEQLYPGWQACRDWLRTHGQSLHAIRFDG
jgi:predicted metal-dependent hydrolase